MVPRCGGDDRHRASVPPDLVWVDGRGGGGWTTISSLATAGGTLILAIATFASVRSANNAARTTEHALEVGLVPLLFPSGLEDAAQKIRWVDDHWARVEGGRATMEAVDGNLYLAMSIRKCGVRDRSSPFVASRTKSRRLTPPVRSS